MQNQIPNNWQKVKLGEVAENFDFKRIPLSSIERSKRKGDIPYYGASGIIDYTNNHLFEGEYLLISEDGENLKSRNTPIAFLTKGKFWVNNHAHIIKAKNNYDNKLIFYWFSKNSISPYITGSAQPKLNQENLNSIELLWPEENIRQNIVKTLSAFDDKIELNNKIAKNLEEMTQTIFKEWFINFRFPGYEKARFIDSELGKIPEGWRVKQLEDVCSRITDGSHWSPKTVEIGHPMASVKDMNEWGFDLTECRKISEEDYVKLVKSDCKPRINDILIAKDGSYLKHVFTVSKDIDLVILSSIAILRSNEELLPELLRLYLLEPNIKSRMKSYVSGAALPRIILESFRKFLIIVPPLSIQRQFYNIVFSGVELRNNLLETNIKLINTRDLLLPKLMKGEIRV